ncbi:NAD(P)H-dependent flavin oxidoreductase [Dongia sedimenti]|uniref:Propionate 3-nitronate monooxygenase n=1 Tax=Dongia sedimenti TaxID=3064282 RepID=A0ABU0YQ29_9PROT|nr:nitronate monooxygenase [Rhodospirillaceae bacterium R-7]
MNAWPDRRILDLFGIALPILQAPMAGASTPEMAIAVSEAGGLGSLPCAQYDLAGARKALEQVRAATKRPINLNFFCHTMPKPDQAEEQRWRARLAVYYRELGLDPAMPFPAGGRTPFDAAFCALVEEMKPEVASFHFGLPEPALLQRVKASGAKVIASATTVREAQWLEERGCDAIIAMGYEAGGHRGNFLTDNPSRDMTRQVGTFALVPQVADAVKVPVIAAGGIADGRGIVAALALGASAVQIGTAYLFTPEAKIPAYHRAALKSAADDDTMVTNLFTGRPARGIANRIMREVGPLSPDAPRFPLAGGGLIPLRKVAEAAGSGDFSNMWAGQAARLGVEMPAGALTRKLASEALARSGR